MMLPLASFATPTYGQDEGHYDSGVSTFLQVPGANDAAASAGTLIAFTTAEIFELTRFEAADGSRPLAAAAVPYDLSEVPDETPPGTKVPEPASLMLVGTGLLALASRIKRLPWKFSRTATAVISCATSDNSSNVDCLVFNNS